MEFYCQTFSSSFIPKMHFLEDHVVPWMKKWKVGLSFHGKQGAESIHAAFKSSTEVCFNKVSPEWVNELTIELLRLSSDSQFPYNPRGRNMAGLQYGSHYYSLTEDMKRRYVGKLSLIDGIDPYARKRGEYSRDRSLLPRITYTGSSA